ncbi:hypothetical protein [Phyllobacterium bourgognense]|uniref:Uncharacterized protein n=1 Tax=Phyllobacterium bourgognense TaxID=314236 RepID=A0A368YG87_9HYPH|nr:hypothetical protein [Phyllobacterium bourgognense]RCW77887.1 hypothetical protein C7476_13410 [Phyllobacterium bourgognense]
MVHRDHKARWVGKFVTAAVGAKRAFKDRKVRLRLTTVREVASHAR